MLLYKDKNTYYEIKPLKDDDIKWCLTPFYHDQNIQRKREINSVVEYAYTKTNVGISNLHDHLIHFQTDIVPICLVREQGYIDLLNNKIIEVELKSSSLTVEQSAHNG